MKNTFNVRSDILPFSRPFFDHREEEAVLRVLRSGWITTGPETAAFEEEFRSMVGARYAAAVTSGTAGLYITLKSLGIGPGDEVIVPSLTWPATANVVETAGATTVFCDVDYDTVCATAETIAPKITGRTRAVIVVHFGGLACDLDPILDLAGNRNITVIEDAAHAAGAQYKGVPIGRPHGAVACFSMHPIKNITSAEGGMLTCHDGELYRRIGLHKFHGISRDAWKRYGGDDLPLYDLEFPALKFNLPDILSAIGRVQLSKLETSNRRRRELAEMYLEQFSGVSELDLPATGSCPDEHAWHLFPVKVNESSGLSRNEFMRRLLERNVRTGLHFLAVHTLKYYLEKYHVPDCKNAEKIGDRILSLPLFPGMSDSDVRYVCAAVMDCFGK
ncbi:aminotransferase class I/II-fold pyridoxal phosphate-dependent enzyme [bacterium]|nr:aminotransferase class I/II-fold pyridoxal phosphate-dependent enzyme [bacterium]